MNSQNFEFHEIRFDENDKMVFNERNENRENAPDLLDRDVVNLEVLGDFPL